MSMTSKITRKPITPDSEEKEFSDVLIFFRGEDEIHLVGNMQGGVLTYPHTEEARASAWAIHNSETTAVVLEQDVG